MFVTYLLFHRHNQKSKTGYLSRQTKKLLNHWISSYYYWLSIRLTCSMMELDVLVKSLLKSKRIQTDVIYLETQSIEMRLNVQCID